MSTGVSVLETIEKLGVEAVAQRYVSFLEGSYEWDDLIHAVWDGIDENCQPIPTETMWGLLLAVIHACPNDDELLWQLGDGPIDNNLIDPELRRRMFAVRDTDPKVMQLFLAMRRMLPSKWEVTNGPWFE